MTYLKYYNNPVLENVKEVHAKNGMTQLKASEIAGVGLQTYKSWLSHPDKTNYRNPHITTWNYFLLELEARRLGYESIKELVELAQNKKSAP